MQENACSRSGRSVFMKRSTVCALTAVSFVFVLFFQPFRAIHAQDTKGGFPAAANTYDIRSFGAKGDGKALDSPAINKAIETAASKGGGTVFIPAGNYRSFSIRLKSNITLYFDQGATLIAASPKDGDGQYDAPEPNQWDKYQDFGHTHWHNSLIWGENIHDVSIMGPGMIWGKGLVRSGGSSRTKEQNDAIANIKVDKAVAPFGYPSPGDTVESGWGNKSIALKFCRNVTIRDISILHGGHFAILATGVDNMTIDNLKIDTNRDGIDIDACRHVRISNTTVNSPYDDGICLKSSYGLGIKRATENVTITNCEVSGYDEGTFLDGTYQRTQKYSNGGPTGRVKFGTESNGGFKNITISNVVFEYCRGLALESVDGGLLEDVTINNITMRDITNSPIFIRLGRRNRGPNETMTPGEIRRVMISNVIAHGIDPKYSSLISGIPENQIEDLRMHNIRIYYAGGGTAAQAAIVVPEKEDDYPEPARLGEMPAYGFFIRHVKGLTMSDVEVSYAAEDARSPFMLTDVAGVDMHRIKAQRSSTAKTFILKDVLDFNARQVASVPDLTLDKVSSKEY